MSTIESKFNQAVRDLTEFVIHRTSGIAFTMSETTTNSFKEFKDETIRNNNVMNISLEGCTNTIYGNEYINVLARVWHDDIHLKHNLNFMEHESIVAKVQREEVFQFIRAKYDHIRAYYVGVLIWLDIQEQVRYYKEKGEFVDNQYEFILTKFKEHF